MVPGDSPRKRLFVAVPLPDSVVAFAQRAQGVLQGEEGLRLADRGQLHCTLAFIGEVGEEEERAAREVVTKLSVDVGGEAVIAGFTYLPDVRRPRVVALDVDDSHGVLGELYETVIAGLEAAGVMQRDGRPFRPHITVARMRRPQRLQPMSDCGRAVFGVESVCLYQSELRREGAVHSVLERKDLLRAYGQRKA